MEAIIPNIQLHAYQGDDTTGIVLKGISLKYKGNRYHLTARMEDTVFVFVEGLAIYVLTVNKPLRYVSVHAYMVPEPAPINSIILQATSDITDKLGPQWEQATPETMLATLIENMH